MLCFFLIKRVGFHWNINFIPAVGAISKIASLNSDKIFHTKFLPYISYLFSVYIAANKFAFLAS